MALKQNIIYIYFKGKHQVTSKSQYQYSGVIERKVYAKPTTEPEEVTELTGE